MIQFTDSCEVYDFRGTIVRFDATDGTMSVGEKNELTHYFLFVDEEGVLLIIDDLNFFVHGFLAFAWIPSLEGCEISMVSDLGDYLVVGRAENGAPVLFNSFIDARFCN